jgi:hypothetical protein
LEKSKNELKIQIMALSNWDLLAIGNDGKSCDGTVKGKLASLQIYKNWIYISSEKMYQNGGNYVDPVIASITDGNLHIGGLNITAIRYPLQDSIFVFVNASTYDENHKEVPNYFAGIGCYGYYTKIKEFLKWKSINIEYDDYIVGSRNYKIGPKYETIPLGKTIEFISLHDKDGNKLYESDIDEEFGELTDFVGVMPETFEAFKNWLKNEISEDYGYYESFKKWFENIDWKSLMRFNQGDAFFVGANDASTKIGEQNDETIMTNALKIGAFKR